jgi:hypothetical protein
MDGDLARYDVALFGRLDRHGVVAGRLEALDAHPLARHAGAEQRGLDQGHERTRPAQIGFGRLEALQGGDDLVGRVRPWLASRWWITSRRPGWAAAAPRTRHRR